MFKYNIKCVEADIKREENINVQLEFELENYLMEKKNLENELNQQRKKNIDLVNDLENELIKNKQLEKELKKNIKNVQGQILEYEYQKFFDKIKYLQIKYENEIDMNREIQQNYYNEEEKKAFDNNIISYYDNGFYNTLERESNKYNYLKADLERKKKYNQLIENKVNGKDLKMNYLHELINKEKNKYFELRINLQNLIEKNENLRNIIKSQISENDELRQKNDELRQKNEELEGNNQILIQKNNQLEKINQKWYSAIKNQIKEIQLLKQKLKEKQKIANI